MATNKDDIIESVEKISTKMKVYVKFNIYRSGIFNPFFFFFYIMLLWKLSSTHLLNEYKISRSGIILFGYQEFVLTRLFNDDIQSRQKIVLRGKVLRNQMHHLKVSILVRQYVRENSTKNIVPYLLFNSEGFI